MLQGKETSYLWKLQQYVTDSLKEENWYEGLPCVFACVTYFCLWWKTIDVLLSNCTCKVLGGLVMLVVIKEKKKKKLKKKKQVSQCVACCLLIGIIVQTQDCEFFFFCDVMWLARMRWDRCESVCDCVAVLSIYYCIIHRHPADKHYTLVNFVFVNVEEKLGWVKKYTEGIDDNTVAQHVNGVMKMEIVSIW